MQIKNILIMLPVTAFLSLSSTTYSQNAWSLKDCIDYAVENNISIKQKEAETGIQKNLLKGAKGKRLPSLNSSISQVFSYGRSMSLNNQIVDQNSNSANFSLDSEATLFNGMQISNSIKKNSAGLKASIEDLEEAKNDIKVKIATVYLEILFAEELVKIKQSQLDATKLQITQTKEKVNAGSLAKGSLLTIMSQYAREEAELVEAQNKVQLEYLNLVQLLELDSYEGFKIESPDLPEVEEVTLAMTAREIYNTALQYRPEIKSGKHRITSSELDLKVKMGALMPRITFGANYRNSHSSLNKLSFSDQLRQNRYHTFGFSMQLPIFNKWETKTSIANAKLGVLTKELELESTKKKLRENIEKSQTNAVTELKKYIAKKKAVTATTESFRYTREKFNVGLVNAVEYNQEKSKLTQVISEMLQSKYRYIFNTKILDFYRGLEIRL